MKRLICVLLAALICLSALCGCASNRPDENSLPPIETPGAEPESGGASGATLREGTIEESGLKYTFYPDGTLLLEGADVMENLRERSILKNYIAGISAIRFGSGVERVGDKAFQGWEMLQRVDFGSDVREIGYNAFSDCTALMAVNFGGVEVIGERAFSGCSSLKDAKLSDTVVEIGDYAFSKCEKLENVSLGPNVARMGNLVFSDCGALIDFKTDSDLPDHALEGCATLASLTLGEGVSSVGDYAFQNCSSLRIVSWPSGLVKIGRSAFAGCAALSTVNIPSSEGLKIGDGAFSDCTALETAVFGPGLEDIGEKCFSGCYKVGTIVLPNTLKSIGFCAFEGTQSLRVLGYTGTDKEWRTVKLATGWNRSAGKTAPTLNYKG